MSERIAVIGAGPAGLAAAWCLARDGVPVDVFEAGPTVGGMSRSLSLWGQTVDVGPHRFFSADARVNRLWLEVVGTGYRMVERLTRIHYNGTLFRYPLRFGDSLPKLGAREAALCVLSYLGRQRSDRDSAANFEQWVCQSFGRRLYEIFFKSYSEKVWGVPCTRLDADFARQRIRKLSMAGAIADMLKSGRGNRHATLVDRFAYPVGGTGSVYRKMAALVADNGGTVRLNCAVRHIHGTGDGRFTVDAGGGSVTCRRVISSMPLTHLVRALSDVPGHIHVAAQGLRFRNTVVVYLRVANPSLFPDQWIYVHSPDLQTGRITNFRNWVPELYGDSPDSIVALEFWCHGGDETWARPDTQFAQMAVDDLRRSGLAGDAPVTGWHVVRVPNCYPVYEIGYRDRISVIREFLDQVPGLDAIGRYGAFKYNNQDHSLLMGILAAENVTRGARHDLWDVNADDRYQEEAVIDETGLVPRTA